MANFSSKSNPDTPQFGSRQPANAPGSSPHCAQCETLLTDFLDGTLAPDDQARFEAHVAGCAACTQMLADAQRGAAWLELLRTPRPEPPAALLERILAQTSTQPGIRPTIQAVAAAPGSLLTLPPAAIPAASLPGVPATVLPFRTRVAAALPFRTLLQPRLAMTAAMAFFSIGLTLNLTGVHLNQIHAADLKPSSVKRSFYQANAHVVRYVDNIRAVYELESRVHDLQRGSDTDAPATPESATPESTAPKQTAKPGQPQNQPQPKQPRSNSGTSWRQAPTPHAILTASNVDETTIRVPQVSLLRPGFSQPQSPNTETILASLTAPAPAATPLTATLSPTTTHQQEGATV